MADDKLPPGKESSYIGCQEGNSAQLHPEHWEETNMASVKLITPLNKPNYYKLTANVTVNGEKKRFYSRFEFDPKVLRTAKSRYAAAMAAAIHFETEMQKEALNPKKQKSIQTFYEVAQEYILSCKARKAPSARLLGNYDASKNKANTTENKETYLRKIQRVSPWFASKEIGQISKGDYERLMEEMEIKGVYRRERTTLRPGAEIYKTASFNKLAEKCDVASYTIAEAFRGKAVKRHTADEIAKALGQPVEVLFDIEVIEHALSQKTMREYALFVRQVMQYAADHYDATKPEFSLPAKGSRPRFVDCLHEDEVRLLLKTLDQCSMIEQAVIRGLLNTGVRRGELAGLTWDDIDFVGCTVHVYKSLLVVKEYGYQLTTTKESNDRYVDVAPEYMEFMRHYYDYWKTKKKLMGASWQTAIEKKDKKHFMSLHALAGNDFVICNDQGWPLNPDGYATMVSRVGERAGIRHLHPHMFRHTFVSLLLSNSEIDVATVAAEAGHAQPSTTLMIYTQQYKKRQQMIRSQLSRELYGN